MLSARTAHGASAAKRASAINALWKTVGKSNGIPAGKRPERAPIHALPTTDMQQDPNAARPRKSGLSDLRIF
jgi:hypothetical protein